MPRNTKPSGDADDAIARALATTSRLGTRPAPVAAPRSAPAQITRDLANRLVGTVAGTPPAVANPK